MAVKKRASRDLTKGYPKKQFIAKLRRLADALERDEQFIIQVAGEWITIPRGAHISIEHEREGGVEEVEFQITWKK